MIYRFGKLSLRTGIVLPEMYNIFCENIPAAINTTSPDDHDITLESAPTAPDLTQATKIGEYSLMTVWKLGNQWIFENSAQKGYLLIDPDYSKASFYCDTTNNIESLQPLLQAFLECALIKSGVAILHASCVTIDGKAILFSAPSGTGKSARARICVEHLGASWLSGDRPAVDPVLGIAYGVPWDGKEQIFTNSAAPIAAIVRIRRSSSTYARRMTTRQKRDFLATQLLIPMWDPLLAHKALIGMQQLIDHVPLYILYSDITEVSIRKVHDILFHQTEQILDEMEEKTMKMKENFTVLEVAGDFMAVPTGENIATFGGAVVLNEVSAFVLRSMKTNKSEEELLELLLNEYDVDRETAAADLKEILSQFKSIGLIE